MIVSYADRHEAEIRLCMDCQVPTGCQMSSPLCALKRKDGQVIYFTTAVRVTLALISLFAVDLDIARSWRGHGRTESEVIVLALTIEGEGAHLFRERRALAGLMIAHTLLNDPRAMTREPQTIDLVASDRFCGYWRYLEEGRKPHRWALEIAEIALVSHDLGVDKSGGALYVFSADDLAAFGIDRAEARERALVHIERGQWGLYTFPKSDFPLMPRS